MTRLGLSPIEYKWKDIRLGDEVRLKQELIDYFYEDTSLKPGLFNTEQIWKVTEVHSNETMILVCGGMSIALKEGNLVEKV